MPYQETVANITECLLTLSAEIAAAKGDRGQEIVSEFLQQGIHFNINPCVSLLSAVSSPSISVTYTLCCHTLLFIVFLETWSLTLKQEHRLRVFENGTLRRIFGPKRDENGEWRRLHNEGLHSLYRSPNIVRVIKSRGFRWAGHVARMGGR